MSDEEKLRRIREIVGREDKAEPIEFVDLQDEAFLLNPPKAFFSAGIDQRSLLRRVHQRIKEMIGA